MAFVSFSKCRVSGLGFRAPYTILKGNLHIPFPSMHIPRPQKGTVPSFEKCPRLAVPFGQKLTWEHPGIFIASISITTVIITLTSILAGTGFCSPRPLSVSSAATHAYHGNPFI